MSHTRVVVLLVLVVALFGCSGDTPTASGGSDSQSSVAAAPRSEAASTLTCRNHFGPVTAPATVQRLDHNVGEMFAPPPPGDPAVDATAALRSVQGRGAADLGNPLTATLVTMTYQDATRVAWLLTVEDVPISGKGGAGEACRAQTFAVDATTGEVVLKMIDPSSPVG